MAYLRAFAFVLVLTCTYPVINPDNVAPGSWFTPNVEGSTSWETPCSEETAP